jgi:glycosyltransferase involved in cell wall biosynthesis
MKIAIVAPATFSDLTDLVEGNPIDGIAFPLISLFARKFHEAGHDVTLISNGTGFKSVTTWEGDRFQLIGTPRRSRARHYCRDFYRDEVNHMLSQIQQVKPDVVHAHWTYEFASAALKSGYPTLVTAHDFPPVIFWYIRDTYRFFRLLYSTKVILQAKNLTTVSPYIAKLFKTFYLKRDIQVIPNGLTIPTITKKHSDKKDIAVALISNWDKRKNVKSALQAFSIARQRCPSVTFHLFGAGHGPGQEASIFAEEQKISDGVCFHGFKSTDFLSRFLLDTADILLHPSLEESFGMSILEAMSIGIPVVAGINSGAVPWVMGNGSGYLVDVTKPIEIADRLVELSNDHMLRAKLGQTGINRVKECFNIDNVANMYLNRLQSLCHS